MTTAFPVMAGVPIPKPRNSVRGSKYPFDTIEIDGWFFVPERHTDQFSTYTSMYGRKLGKKFRTRMVTAKFVKSRDTWEMCDPDAKGVVEGVGVWRVS